MSEQKEQSGKEPENTDDAKGDVVLADQLAESKAQLQAILDASTQPIFLKDINKRYLLINKQYERLSGTTNADIKGKTDHDVFPKDIANLFQSQDAEVLEAGAPLDFEETVLLPVGERTFLTSKFPLYDANGEIYAVGGACTDITERIQMERDLLRMEKLESVGVLAGGIAHDFNNLLMAILGNISLSLTLIDESHRAYPLLESSQEASLRAKSLTQQLLTFARGGDPVLKTSSLFELIRESAEFVLRGSSVKVDYQLSPDLWLVEIDTGQMSQVIQNLVINARHAMPVGGTISIIGTNVDTVAADLCAHLRPGRHVKISIQDEGIGIPESVLDKIFDPYFSTKQQGSGLGLAITSSTIAKHRGHVSVTSKKGEGTRFEIYLPASSRTEIVEDTAPGTGSNTGGRVLVMDDEETIREVSRLMLEHLGYEVVEARDGSEAVRTYKEAIESDRPIDVSILDLTVPGGAGGVEAAKEILEIDPDAMIVVSSGYSMDPVMSNHREYGFQASIAKPFQIDDLDKLLCTLFE